MFIIAQIFGLVASFAAILCVQARTPKGVLIGQIIGNGCSGLSYALLGSFSGAWVCLLASVHSMVISYLRKFDKPVRSKWIKVVSVVFAVAYVLGSVMTFSRWPDVISCVCALLFVFTIAQEEASGMRNVMLVSMSLWVVFDIFVGAYTSIITHGSTVLSLITAKIRLDRNKSKA